MIFRQTEVKNKIRVLLAQQNEEMRLAIEKGESGLFIPKGLEFMARLHTEGREKEVLEDLIQGDQEISGAHQEGPYPLPIVSLLE
jgi:hypothetical protein